MSQNLDTIEQAILNALNEFAKEYWDKNEKGNITEQMFTKLGELGRGYDYIVCSKLPIHETEFLWDMVWFRNDADGYLASVDLVLESELNTNETELYNDFTKILISNAPHKIFICTSNPEMQIPLFEKCVEKCHNMKKENRDKVTVFIWDDYEMKKKGGVFIAHQIIKQ